MLVDQPKSATAGFGCRNSSAKAYESSPAPAAYEPTTRKSAFHRVIGPLHRSIKYRFAVVRGIAERCNDFVFS